MAGWFSKQLMGEVVQETELETTALLRIMLVQAALVSTALVAAACGDELPRPEQIRDLRIVGVRAEPPEAPAGGTLSLDALVLHPRPDVIVERSWLVCSPALGEPSSVCLERATTAIPPPCAEDPQADVCWLGREATASHTLREGAAGLIYVMLLVAETEQGGLGACLAEIADTGTAPAFCRLAVKRVPVLGEGETPNRNPTLAKIDAQASEDHVAVWVQLGDGAVEETPEGPEPLFLSWFVTAGELKRFRSEADPDGLQNEWTPLDVEGTLAVVVRDGRGGEGWITWARPTSPP